VNIDHIGLIFDSMMADELTSEQIEEIKRLFASQIRFCSIKSQISNSDPLWLLQIISNWKLLFHIEISWHSNNNINITYLTLLSEIIDKHPELKVINVNLKRTNCYGSAVKPFFTSMIDLPHLEQLYLNIQNTYIMAGKISLDPIKGEPVFLTQKRRN